MDLFVFMMIDLIILLLSFAFFALPWTFYQELKYRTYYPKWMGSRPEWIDSGYLRFLQYFYVESRKW